MTPDDAAHGELDTLADAELPMLAARWLASGYDSPQLRDIAGMSVRESPDARRLMPEVLASIGHPLAETDLPWDEAPWRGYWGSIGWAVHQIDRRLTPYAAAQRVVEVVGDLPELWEPGRGRELVELLRRWDTSAPAGRQQIENEIRTLLRSLNRDDVPPLGPPDAQPS